MIFYFDPLLFSTDWRVELLNFGKIVLKLLPFCDFIFPTETFLLRYISIKMVTFTISRDCFHPILLEESEGINLAFRNHVSEQSFVCFFLNYDAPHYWKRFSMIACLGSSSISTSDDIGIINGFNRNEAK